MAAVPTSVKQHFSHSHPNHPLMHHVDDGGYICHGCQTSGYGARFRCHACVVDMHMYCADCPHELSSFFHSHRLALVVSKPRGARPSHRYCDVCQESINGIYYRCKDCDFDVHPLCTQLPRKLRHVTDDKHKLRLKKLSSGNCVVCDTDCSSLWVYGCGVCKVNIHLKCLRKPYVSQCTQSREIPVPPSSSGGSSSSSRGVRYAQPWWSTGQPPFLGRPYPYGYNGFVYPNSFGHWGFPNHQFVYPPGAIHGSVPFAHNNNPSHWPNHVGNAGSSSSSWGSSIFGNTMFSLIENLAVGAMSDFIFGSIGF